MKKGLDFQSFFCILRYKKDKTMGKYLKQGFVRELEWQLAREEISHSKMVELMDAEAKKNLKDEMLQIITEHDFELGKASLRKKIMNL